MYKRQPLDVGKVYSLYRKINGKTILEQFTLTKVIGEGASSIVYIGTKENEYNICEEYIIKECYPDAIGIKRNVNCLTWSDDYKRKCHDSFVKSHSLLNDLKGCEEIDGNFVNPLTYEANNTYYSVVNLTHAKLYSVYKDNNLLDILKIVRVLSNVIHSVHQMGYLHLDIKPSNFLIRTSPSENVVLFDVDSFVKKVDLHSGKIKKISYSHYFSAPEVKNLDRVEDIRETADIYSIGVILFERLMKRKMTSYDKLPSASWILDNDLFVNISNGVKEKIKGLFRRTLSYNPKDRYHSIENLSKDLNVIISQVENSYNISNFPIEKSLFLHRNNDLERIHNELNKINTIFLYGETGIGKTSLALNYAKQYHSIYQNIFYIDCDSISIKGDLPVKFNKVDKEIEYNLFLDRLIHNYHKYLGTNDIHRTIRESSSLIILDNFDIANAYDFEKLLISNAKIIIISDRITLKELDDLLCRYLDNNVISVIKYFKEYSLPKMHFSELKDIFEYACEETIYYVSALEEIFDSISYNTELAYLYGKALWHTGLYIGTLRDMLNIEFPNSATTHGNKNKLFHHIDFIVKKLIKAEINLTILIDIYLLESLKLNKETYRRLLGKMNAEFISILNKYVHYGLIIEMEERRYKFYKLNSFIKEYVEQILPENISEDYIERFREIINCLRLRLLYEDPFFDEIDIFGILLKLIAIRNVTQQSINLLLDCTLLLGNYLSLGETHCIEGYLLKAVRQENDERIKAAKFIELFKILEQNYRKECFNNNYRGTVNYFRNFISNMFNFVNLLFTNEELYGETYEHMIKHLLVISKDDKYKDSLYNSKLFTEITLNENNGEKTIIVNPYKRTTLKLKL